MIGWFDAEDTYRDNPALREPFRVLHERARQLVEERHAEHLELMQASFPMYWGDEGQILFPKELSQRTGIPAREIAAIVRTISKEIFDDWRSTKEWAEIEALLIEGNLLTPEQNAVDHPGDDDESAEAGDPTEPVPLADEPDCFHALPALPSECTRRHLAHNN